jgi:acylpyruvate hydrolase
MCSRYEFIHPFPPSLVAHGAPVMVPEVSRQVDWEAELAVIIGKPGKRIAGAGAHDHVGGYMPFNDFSIRDCELRNPTVHLGAGKALIAKDYSDLRW